MVEKIIILGGRAGTSLMARLIEHTGAVLLSENGETEHKSLKEVIMSNINRPGKIKEYIDSLPHFDLIKLPEASLCLPVFLELFPNARYIEMTRPIMDRVASHIHLGWHHKTYKQINTNRDLTALIKEKTGVSPGDALEADTMYFQLLDILTHEFMQGHTPRTITIAYDFLLEHFNHLMQQVCHFLGISYEDNVSAFRTLRKKKHQAGRPHIIK